jgi:hypothetical protein
MRAAISGSPPGATERSLSSARMKAIASCACAGVATRPVPIAQIGS